MNHIRRFGASLDALSSGNRAPLRHVSGTTVSRTSLGNAITPAFVANAERDVAMGVAYDGRPHFSLPRNVPNVHQRNADVGRNIQTAMRHHQHMQNRRPLALEGPVPMEVEEIDLF